MAEHPPKKRDAAAAAAPRPPGTDRGPAPRMRRPRAKRGDALQIVSANGTGRGLTGILCPAAETGARRKGEIYCAQGHRLHKGEVDGEVKRRRQYSFAASLQRGAEKEGSADAKRAREASGGTGALVERGCGGSAPFGSLTDEMRH